MIVGLLKLHETEILILHLHPHLNDGLRTILQELSSAFLQDCPTELS